LPELSKAPIVEAVLEIKTVPVEVWEENTVTEKVKTIQLMNGMA